jgi:hypothetical protein
MSDIDEVLRRLGAAEPDKVDARIDADVMSRIALLSPARRNDGLLQWGGVTAMSALAVGALSGSVLAAPSGLSSTSAPFSAGLALAPSTLLASAR